MAAVTITGRGGRWAGVGMGEDGGKADARRRGESRGEWEGGKIRARKMGERKGIWRVCAGLPVSNRTGEMGDDRRGGRLGCRQSESQRERRETGELGKLGARDDERRVGVESLGTTSGLEAFSECVRGTEGETGSTYHGGQKEICIPGSRHENRRRCSPFPAVLAPSMTSLTPPRSPPPHPRPPPQTTLHLPRYPQPAQPLAHHHQPHPHHPSPPPSSPPPHQTPTHSA